MKRYSINRLITTLIATLMVIGTMPVMAQTNEPNGETKTEESAENKTSIKVDSLVNTTEHKAVIEVDSLTDANAQIGGDSIVGMVNIDKVVVDGKATAKSVKQESQSFWKMARHIGVRGLNTLLMIVVAICITGVINRTRALLAGRKGIRFFQHIYNVRLLLRKGSVYSPTTSILFRIAPCVYLGAVMVAFLFIPVADLWPAISFQGDIILVAYLLALSRVAIVLAALDTGSSFEGMGAAREALYGALVEPALMVGLATLALFCGDTSFAEIFATTQHLDLNLTVVLLLVAYIFVMILFIEAGRVPVDDPKTHLELTMIHEVMCLDYSGIDLGMIQIAGWLKNSIFAIIAANAISVAFCFHWWFAVPLAVLGTGMAVGIVESLRARNKLSRNPTYILTIGILAALVLLIGFLLFNQENLGL